MPLILRRKPPRPPRTVGPIEPVHALNPRHPLIVRQERAYGPWKVYDLLLGQYVDNPHHPTRHWWEADEYRAQLLELDRLTPAAQTWTAADEREIRRMCS